MSDTAQVQTPARILPSTPHNLTETLTRKDIRDMSARMSDEEARFLVDYYYIAQEDRKRFDSQVRAMKDEPNMILTHMANQSRQFEDIIRKALDDYSSNHPVGAWLRGVHGVGPVIAAGLLAYIDITKAKTAGSVQRYAGLDPTRPWLKGEKRPHNASLKTLCFNIGQSFVKTSGSDNSFYGKLYKERKQFEVERNESGGNAEAAAKELQTKNYSKTTATYACLSEGKLSPAHLDARARRWTVKMFLSHLFDEMYRKHYKEEPPKPYAIAHLDHVHMIEAPAPVLKGKAAKKVVNK